MAQSVYKLFLAKFAEAWYQLSKEEQDNLLAKVGDALQKAGGKTVVLCDSNWASEQWTFFGVEEYPNLESLQEHTKILNSFNWFRYIESMTLMGTEWPMQ